MQPTVVGVEFTTKQFSISRPAVFKRRSRQLPESQCTDTHTTQSPLDSHPNQLLVSLQMRHRFGRRPHQSSKTLQLHRTGHTADALEFLAGDEGAEQQLTAVAHHSRSERDHPETRAEPNVPPPATTGVNQQPDFPAPS